MTINEIVHDWKQHRMEHSAIGRVEFQVGFLLHLIGLVDETELMKDVHMPGFIRENIEVQNELLKL